MKMPMLFSAMVAAALIAGQASAQSGLKNEVKITDGIIFVGMAYELSEKCDDISARLFRGLSYLQSLKREASALGYTDDQIDDYVDNDDEKDRLEAIARARLASLGVVEGDEATYCTVARAQIDANTRVGWLLR